LSARHGSAAARAVVAQLRPRRSVEAPVPQGFAASNPAPRIRIHPLSFTPAPSQLRARHEQAFRIDVSMDTVECPESAWRADADLSGISRRCNETWTVCPSAKSAGLSRVTGRYVHANFGRVSCRSPSSGTIVEIKGCRRRDVNIEYILRISVTIWKGCQTCLRHRRRGLDDPVSGVGGSREISFTSRRRSRHPRLEKSGIGANAP